MLSAVLLLQASWVTAQTTTTPCLTDCKVGRPNWEIGWAQWKKDYCCKHENFGCPTTTTTSWQYDCKAGLNNWRIGWAQSKLAYCCKHEGVGCPDTQTTICSYDCRAALNNWEAAWAPSKKDWCCKHEGLGCSTTSTTTTQLDCRAAAAAATAAAAAAAAGDGDSSQRMLWTPSQQQWCCTHDGVGCPPTIIATLPDCTLAAGGNTNSWSRQKREWCCKHEGITCPVFDCSSAMARSPTDWSTEQREWCCQHHGRGCIVVGTAARKSTSLSTTTTTTFDCTTAGLRSIASSTPKALWCCKFKGRGCPKPAQPSRSLATDVMHCDLSCLGAPAVPLPGSTGSGKGASLNDVSVEECRKACSNSGDCEGIVYTNVTHGTPFRSMCFGRRDIHTSMCQPGGQHFTELIGTYPRGKCALFGDPHIISFDRVYGPPITMLTAGEYHLIKSGPLSIQGRFGYTKRFPTAASTVGIAIGGSMVKGHTLVVVFTGPMPGAEGFKVFWDEKQILADYPSTFASVDGLLAAKYEAMDPQKHHREGRHTIGGEKGLLPSYLFEFSDSSHDPPLFLTLYVLLGPDNVNAVITTWKVVGGQDGYCGNFNCNQADDGLEALKVRGASLPIPAGESLFKHGADAPAWVMRQVDPPSFDDCDPAVKSRAEHACKGLPEGGAKACIFDACAAHSAEAARADAQEDMATLAFEQQPMAKQRLVQQDHDPHLMVKYQKEHVGGFRFSEGPRLTSAALVAFGACLIAVAGAVLVARRRLRCGLVAASNENRAEEVPLMLVAA